jgi:hypothetical protein
LHSRFKFCFSFIFGEIKNKTWFLSNV